jgi:hypothetical protein
MKEERDPHDGEYIGNIFGPRLTRYGLLFLLLVLGLALYRHWSLGVGPGWEMEEEAAPPDTSGDSLRLENPQ